MKYIKTYENIEDFRTSREVQIGDYIIAKFIFNKIWDDYINNQIGKLTKNEHPYNYQAKYDVSEDIYNSYFKHKRKGDRDFIKGEKGKRYIIMHFNKNNIRYFSPNKEDLEILIAADKYNL
jgi:hypothetical protein